MIGGVARRLMAFLPLCFACNSQAPLGPGVFSTETNDGESVHGDESPRDAEAGIHRADAGSDAEVAAARDGGTASVAKDAGLAPSGDAAPLAPPHEVGRGKAVMMRSCVRCHDATHEDLSLVTAEGVLDERAVAIHAELILVRIRSAERPMPPALVGGSLAITPEERAFISSYVEWLHDPEIP